MRTLILAASLLALAACNQAQEPAQSAAASSAGASDEQKMVDPDSASGRRELEAMITSFLDQTSDEYGQGFQKDVGLGDHIEFMQLSGSPDRWQVNLNAGVNYRFIGVCDNECDNVDIELMDAGNTVVASDVLPDKVPVVTYQPSAAGTYTVTTHLRTCTQEPCVVGVRALFQ